MGNQATGCQCGTHQDRNDEVTLTSESKHELKKAGQTKVKDEAQREFDMKKFIQEERQKYQQPVQIESKVDIVKVNQDEKNLHKPNEKNYKSVESMNKVSPKAFESAVRMGEFQPVLKSDCPELPVFGPVKDVVTGSTYKGQFKEGKKHGLGCEVFLDGLFFEGHFNQGKKSGQGRLISANGDLFQGEFKNDQSQGEGCLFTAASKTVYTGPFEQDLPHGRGKEEYDDGSVYIGEFVRGVMAGNCKFIFADGGIYQGMMVNGKALGKGKYIYKNTNKVYEGEYKDNLKHGRGVLTTQDYTYEGEFSMGAMQGLGEFRWKNGKKAKGNLVNGQLHGVIDLVTKNQEVKQAQYEHGVLKKYIKK